MKLKNDTTYNGTDIRGLITACARYYEIKMGNGHVFTFLPKHASHRLAWASRASDSNSFDLKLCPPKHFIDKLSIVDKLAAVTTGGWAAAPVDNFNQLCRIIEWIVRGADHCRNGEMTWAKGRQLRYKVPKVKFKVVGADYHQAKVDKLDKQIKGYEDRLRKAKIAVTRLQHGLKIRQKDRRRHVKARDRKASA